jgi:hypothetical protein
LIRVFNDFVEGRSPHRDGGIFFCPVSSTLCTDPAQNQDVGF